MLSQKTGTIVSLAKIFGFSLSTALILWVLGLMQLSLLSVALLGLSYLIYFFLVL